MTIVEVGQLALAVAAFGSFLTVAVERWRLDGHAPTPDWRRLMFTDALLVVAALELVAEAVHQLGVHGPVDTIATSVVLLCHGMLIAGALALLLSMRQYPHLAGTRYRGPERRNLGR